ncbi:hypothetical protein [Spirosoma koreense]
MITTQLLNRYTPGLIFLSLWLAGCQPKQDSLQPEPVPASLLVTAKPDSIITLTERVDFSTISETGQGPKGTLIRWDYLGIPSGSFQANTYDAQNRLTGTLSISYGYQVLNKYAYQGGLLTQVFSGNRFDVSQPLRDVQPWQLTNYQYNESKQLVQLLIYSRIDSSDLFRLTHTMRYEYDAGGQLQITRLNYTEKIGPTRLISYWKNGDCINDELYYPASADSPNPIVVKHSYEYNNQNNPYAHRLHPINQLSEHNRTRMTSYGTSGSPPMGQYEENQFEYDRQYDLVGRLIQQRSRSLAASNSRQWAAWGSPDQFTYAP